MTVSSAKEKLISLMEEYGIYSDDRIQKLEQYMDGILQWNTKVNLTNIVETDDFIEKHYIDSIIGSEPEIFRNASSVIDVGTGGGFPGVPLAICYPEKKFTLLDSLNKRLRIIDQLTEECGIYNVETFHGRAEDAGRMKEFRENFDLCISRAVANLATLSELCIPFVKNGGYFIAYKGPGVYEELEAAEKSIKILGGEVVSVLDAGYRSEYDHKLLIIKKIKNTSSKYPRKPGEPLKNPIK